MNCIQSIEKRKAIIYPSDFRLKYEHKTTSPHGQKMTVNIFNGFMQTEIQTHRNIYLNFLNIFFTRTFFDRDAAQLCVRFTNN
jgi:hypothetical protein